MSISPLGPRFVGADEVDQVDCRLEMAVRGDVLIVSRGCNVVGKAQTVVAVPEVHVQQPLVGAVEGDAPLSHSHESVVLAHVGG